jgi:hypothetical protein
VISVGGKPVPLESSFVPGRTPLPDTSMPTERPPVLAVSQRWQENPPMLCTFHTALRDRHLRYRAKSTRKLRSLGC